MKRIERFLKTVCVQTALYWEFDGSDGYGQANYKAPREIACRWQDEVIQLKGKDTKEIVSKAQLLVLEDLKENSILALKKLSDIDSTTDPLELDDAYEVMTMSKIPMIKSTDDFVRTIYLI